MIIIFLCIISKYTLLFGWEILILQHSSMASRFRYLWSARFWLASLATLVVSILIMAAMSLWLPAGNASIDKLVIPIILFPLIWATVFFYVVLERKVGRAAYVLLLLFLVNGGLVAASIMGLLS